MTKRSHPIDCPCGAAYWCDKCKLWIQHGWECLHKKPFLEQRKDAMPEGRPRRPPIELET
jgi:hypothetical protein